MTWNVGSASRYNAEESKIDNARERMEELNQVNWIWIFKLYLFSPDISQRSEDSESNERFHRFLLQSQSYLCYNVPRIIKYYTVKYNWNL
jgi:hypothetical protein